MIKEDYKFTTLTNGIRVVTENLPHVNSFSLGFWFNTGSRNENRKTNGISHFTEHMLFKGTSKRSSKRISDDVEKLGGYLNAFTSKEHTCYYGRGVGALFREKDIEKESGVILDEFYDIEDSPEELIFDRFESNIFKSHPLHYPIIGTEKNIKEFKRNDFLEYLQKYYTTNNLLIAASGNVSHEKIVELVESKITGLHKSKIKSKNSLAITNQSDLLIKKDIQQTHVIIGKETFGFRDTDRLKVNILANIIGEGSSSRLFNVLREKNGLTYQINSFLNSFADYSAFGIYFSTNEKQADKAVDLVGKEFEKIRKNGITKVEFSRAKEYMKGNLIMHLESTTNRMIRIAQSNLYLNRTKKIQESIDAIDSITLDGIVDISKGLLDINSLSKVMISSKK
jgi:predicted Zn-dependent peptidase